MNDTSPNRIYQVTDNLYSKYTKRAYQIAFNQFLTYGAKIKTQDVKVLLDKKPREIEAIIIGYIEDMRDKGKAHRTIKLHCASIFNFLELNDIILNKRKITKFIPYDEESTYSDKAYDVDDILRLVDACDIRTKVMVLLMASTGMRRGAISGLLMKHLTPIPEYNLYRIEVYANSRKWRYVTYCTPECRNVLDTYLDFRRRNKENITGETPLIRELFSPSNPFTINTPKQCTEKMIILSLEKALHKAGINQRPIGLRKGKRREIMLSHGLRKFCLTKMKKAGIDFSDRHSLLGHKSNVSNDLHYDRTEENDRLLAYVKAVDLLTIEDSQRLKARVSSLESERDKELGDLRQEFNEMKRLLVNLKKGTQKKLVDEFEQKTSEELQKEFWESENLT